MMRGQVHRGRHLLCRVAWCDPATVIVGVIDPAGDEMILAIPNHPILPRSLGQPFNSDYNVVFSEGRIICIKEPFCKEAGDSCLLKVDSPSDVVFISQFDPLLQSVEWKDSDGKSQWSPPKDKRTPEQCKQSGNQNFQNKKYLAAERDYSSPIEQFGASKETLLHLLNRAEVFLRLERFNAAARDAQSVIDLLLGSSLSKEEQTWMEKGSMRKARAFEGLQRWKDAKEEYAKLNAQDGVRRCLKRIIEGATGKYDIVEMYRRSKETPNPRLQVGDYIGPIEVKEMPERGGGRGVIATKDINPGDLIMACSAFSIVYSSELPANQTDDKNQLISLRREIAYRLLDRPEDVPKIHNLYAGPSLASSSYRFDGQMEWPHHYPDPERIDGIVTYNVFAPGQLAFQQFEAAALFDRPSLTNHSCLPNAHWTMIGDVHMIRAIRPIAHGEEVTISYATGQTLKERSDLLKTYLGDCKCECQLCIEERSDGPEKNAHREELMQKIKDFEKNVSKVEIPSMISSIRRFGDDLEKTYGRHRTIKPQLFHVHQRISALQAQMGRMQGSIDAMLKALQCIGIKLANRDSALPIQNVSCIMGLDDIIPRMIHIAGCYRSLNDQKMKDAWLNAVKWTINTMLGAGDEMITELYGEYLTMYKLS
eukprot:TRINITY_DN10776_c0_g1_i1.p1 TRINITY_DN10776_c0_g1~~TRINITY_DN10776_c0_g1_i1.p1  ORF type:complete len:705 (+),score=151.91 TRINITY_DN10776_c0_g1_i1:168-2117(+)